MIRMVQTTSAKQAKEYFSGALLQSDYYMDGQELKGRYAGSLATHLGLPIEPTRQSFFALCDNINPVSGKPLTRHTKEGRTVAYDIVFNAPKSVSIIHALSNDDHILKAFQDSVQQTMQDIETDSRTRVRINKSLEDRQTGNLLWAEFTHQTARPVDGSLPDVHLHSHNVVINATYDPIEKTIKAGQFRDIKKSMPFYQAMFHKRLSDRLMDLGYGIRRTDKAFEILNVPQAAIDHFSKRTNAIGEFAKEKGINDPKKLAELGAKTRAKKQKGHTMAELKAEWRRQLRQEVQLPVDEEALPIRYATKNQLDKTIAEDVIDHALKHSFERASVKPERRILETAYRQSIGKRQLSIVGITDSFKNDSRIIRIKEKYQTVCTTKPVLAEEQQMVKLARQGLNSQFPLFSKAPELSPFLNEHQRNAITDVLTTTDQTSIVRGAAGTGKTTIMSEARKHIEAAGKQLFVVAPTAQAARGVLVNEGFENANTVARLLKDKEMQQEIAGQVLWVDEAGLLGTKDMTELLTITKQQNARLILGGDTRQHTAVARGDALRVLNFVGQIKSSDVSKIVRQKDVHYREAVEDLSNGNICRAFTKLNSIGAVKDIDPLKPNDLLINDYIRTLKKGKSALIVSPTHAQGEAVTQELRDKLRANGLIGKKQVLVDKFVSRNLTEAEKTDHRNLNEGDVVQFNQNVPQIKKGSVWKIERIENNQVLVKNKDGEEQQLPLDRASSFDVFEHSLMGLSKGDVVRISRNGYDNNQKRLNNGQVLDVTGINKKGKILLNNRSSKVTYELDDDFGNIAHAYCTTSYSAQGRTVSEVFISQPSATFVATNAKQFYVSVSRGKDAAHIYTDDRQALLEYASQLGDRQSALELVGGYQHADYIRQQIGKEPDHDNEPEERTRLEVKNNSRDDYEPGF
ncbi:conjugal transfer protein [Mucilaginibacter sp. MD40]|uniref:MobF family relaxase n=1 Tax=Mucilaginibacter sp. MD40 TaxID=2029590 RepID=UPI000BACA6CD|nr:MobF family relaxase [Mucilaginibacter sp. MD40]PAW93159.1 conjugal transfer protein [Mucilaginibacter sp. MD40]